jgi:hypothetical protein
VVVGGHGTTWGEVGVQPTNNHTERPAGYANIDSSTLAALSEARKEAIRRAISTDGVFEVQSCGLNQNEAAGQSLANLLQRKVRFAIGTMHGWNETPTDAKYNGQTHTGRWATKSPSP